MRRIAAACIVLSLITFAALAAEKAVQRSATVRSGPGVYFPVVTKIDQGKKLSVIEERSHWTKVRIAAGQEGWVSSRVFAAPAKPSGYGKALSDNGLRGASTTVVTMAARGLQAPSGKLGSALDPVLDEFLQKAAFRPEGLGDFLGELKPVACGELLKMPGVPRQLESDPGLDEIEHRLGLAAATRIISAGKLLSDPALDDYVNKVGMAVAMYSNRYDLSWRFVVLDSTGLRAMGLPGGFVIITSGLLRALSDEAGLAGVLAHEVAHVVLGHGSAELARAIPKGQGPSGKFDLAVSKAVAIARSARSRSEEIAADKLGSVLCACAGYDPLALQRAYSRLANFEPAGADSLSAAERAASLDAIWKDRKNSGAVTLADRFAKIVHP